MVILFDHAEVSDWLSVKTGVKKTESDIDT